MQPASSSCNQQLSEEIKNGFHENADSAADIMGMTLPTGHINNQRNKEQVDSLSHNKTTELVVNGLPRENFRETSCASSASLPMLDVENSELKMEDIDQTVQETNSSLSDKLLTVREERGKNVKVDTDNSEVIIGDAEQCVDATVCGKHLVTASHINEEGPKFWHLHNGVLDVEMTSNIDAEYKKSLAKQGITFGGRNHAQLFCFSKFLVYIRKQSTSITACVFWVLPKDSQCSIFAHIHLPDSYFSVLLPADPSSSTPKQTDPSMEHSTLSMEQKTLAPKQTTSAQTVSGSDHVASDGLFLMYIVRNGKLEERSSDMKLLRTIEVPRLTEDIPNLSSSSGKKKLLSYKIAVTEDWRYFVIVCPAVGGKSGRYLDVVDLKANCYLQRCALDCRFMWRVLEDGLYYLVCPSGSDHFELVSVRTMKEKIQTYSYCCIMQSDLQIRSPDGQYCVELTPDHSIHIWKMASTPNQNDPSLKDNMFSLTEQTTSILEQNTPPAQTAASACYFAVNVAECSPTPEQTDPSWEDSMFSMKQRTPTVEHYCVLTGHVAEVTCVSWTSPMADSRRLLVSGSRDNTVRLWDLDGGTGTMGSQLCLFHVLGTIDNVHFDDSWSYVVVHCSYAPQRKRAIVLRISSVLT